MSFVYLKHRRSQFQFQNQYSYLFDGVDERININAVQTALATTTKGTWSAWVKPVDATPANYQMLLTFGDGVSTDLIQLYINPTTGILTISVHDNGVTLWSLETNANPFSDNVWAHIAIVQDAVSTVLYFNATVPAQSFSISIDKTIWFNNLVLNNGRIGARFYAADNELPFNGNIDEVGFFNTNLTAAQITEIYNNGKPNNLLNHSASSNLVSYFRMGDGDTWDGTNWTLIDKKGTNNGTSVNMEETDRELDVI